MAARVIFTPEACHLVSEALTGTPPGAPHLEGFASSWGRRDARAIAYTRRFTVGVWAGDFSGEGSTVSRPMGEFLGRPVGELK